MFTQQLSANSLVATGYTNTRCRSRKCSRSDPEFGRAAGGPKVSIRVDQTNSCVLELHVVTMNSAWFSSRHVTPTVLGKSGYQSGASSLVNFSVR